MLQTETISTPGQTGPVPETRHEWPASRESTIQTKEGATHDNCPEQGKSED
ncbi:MAG: hypothetical protein KJ804_18660 [Proteobacteria bacterium]|nr:hypothetical protein [Pseudomonadota bacterium]MBU1060332.1 hypothetical protein [Pseudomonadota bacterium]